MMIVVMMMLMRISTDGKEREREMGCNGINLRNKIFRCVSLFAKKRIDDIGTMSVMKLITEIEK